ncbi:MAG: metallophosphoesterase [Prevotella sp.]|jgi:hypothetical protein|nr:metallophosphoesterase [Prevotella sp.]
MRPTIAIGDIHGLTYWKEVVGNNPDCLYVFLGDYLDPYEDIDYNALIDNLKEIIQLKKDHPDDVILLLGNHDLHYFTTDIAPGSRFVFDIAEDVSKLFLDNIHLFQYAYQKENCVFTHAGIAHRWFVNDFKGDLERNIADQLNNPSPKQVEALCRCGFYRGGAFNDIGGIFWADKRELYEPLKGYTQIVGHNRVKDIIDHTNDGGRIIFCDCLFNKHYLKI